jgi:hypothetical protein
MAHHSSSASLEWPLAALNAAHTHLPTLQQAQSCVGLQNATHAFHLVSASNLSHSRLPAPPSPFTHPSCCLAGEPCPTPRLYDPVCVEGHSYSNTYEARCEGYFSGWRRGYCGKCRVRPPCPLAHCAHPAALHRMTALPANHSSHYLVTTCSQHVSRQPFAGHVLGACNAGGGVQCDRSLHCLTAGQVG